MGPAKPSHGGLHLSATRVDTFAKCKRKWAFEYIQRIPYAPSPWLAFGTLFHAHAERYFGTGKLPADFARLLVTPNDRLTEDEIAAKLFLGSLKHWPKYRPNYFEVERAFQTEVPGGLFTGSVDLVLMLEQIIGDHKTTSDLKWAPDVGTLITWPQPVCYSYHTSKELGWTENRCRWVYTEKATGRTQVVHTKDPIPFSYWEDEWLGTYLPLTTEMAELHAQQADPLELSGAQDTDFCEAYGGCQFRHLCPSYQQRNSAALFEGFDGDDTMATDTNDLDALLGTTPEAPEQDIGNTATSEPDPDLDALFNPPARTNVPSPKTEAPPPLADVTPTTETQAKAEAEAASKPKKEPKPKKPKSTPAETVMAPVTIAPEARAALDALKSLGATETEAQEIVADEGPRAITGAETKMFPAPTPAPVPQGPVIPHALGEGLALLVGVYMSEPGALQGRSWTTAQTAVRELAQVYQGPDLIVRAVETIVALRRAFGDAS